MAGKNKNKGKNTLETGTAAQNRRARHDYDIIETFEAGIMLTGSEVKSLRLGRASIGESFAQEKDGELFLQNVYIPEYEPASRHNGHA
ncbi:MAG: SsrA-binding protein, partial [Rhodospirillales bacterium]